MGKTELCLHLIHRWAVKDKIPVAVYDMEDGDETFANQLLANFAKLPCHKLRLGTELSPEEKHRKEIAMKQLSDSPLYLNSTYMEGMVDTALTMENLSKSIREVVMRHGVKVIFVMGFQYLDEGYSTNNIYRRQALALKNLARELNVIIIASSFLNWCVDNREGMAGKFPQLSDLRYVGDLDEISDIVLGLFRPVIYNVSVDWQGNDISNILYLSLLKTNVGVNGCVMDLEIDGDTMSICCKDENCYSMKSWHDIPNKPKDKMVFE
jgi:replicative DNA helicase